MTDPCKGSGANHYACPCTLRRIKKLEAALETIANFKPFFEENEVTAFPFDFSAIAKKALEE